MQWFHFQAGWLNLWILALIIFATPVLLNLIRGQKGKGGLARATVLPPMSPKERVAYLLVMAPQFLLPIYAVFVPFTQNAILLSVGFGLFTVGQIFRLKSIWDYTTIPTDELITQGVYQISRNPGYFGVTVLYLGMGIAGGSWLIVAVAIYGSSAISGLPQSKSISVKNAGQTPFPNTSVRWRRIFCSFRAVQSELRNQDAIRDSACVELFL